MDEAAQVWLGGINVDMLESPGLLPGNQIIQEKIKKDWSQLKNHLVSGLLSFSIFSYNLSILENNYLKDGSKENKSM